MEPVSSTLGAIAAALVAKATETTADRAVAGGAGALAKLVTWLRQRFSAEEEQRGTRALARVEDAPDSRSRLSELAEVLDRRAETDAEFRSKLKSLVDEADRSGVDVGSIAQTVWGNQNVQAAAAVDSDITVTYGQPRPCAES